MDNSIEELYHRHHLWHHIIINSNLWDSDSLSRLVSLTVEHSYRFLQNIVNRDTDIECQWNVQKRKIRYIYVISSHFVTYLISYLSPISSARPRPRCPPWGTCSRWWPSRCPPPPPRPWDGRGTPQGGCWMETESVISGDSCLFLILPFIVPFYRPDVCHPLAVARVAKG